MKLLNIGFGNMVNADRIIGIVSPDSAPIKRLVQDAREKGALHMSCVKCGKTFHMASGNAALFAKHLAQSEQFTLDAADTILYGICSDCKGK